jgi:MBG domain-containing protein/VCBS repeat protein
VPTYTATIVGFVNGDTAATAITGSASLSTTPTTPSVVGAYPITAAIGTLAASNYTFTFVNGTLTIGKAILTVTAGSPTITYGQSVPTYTATITGFVNGDTLATAVTGSAGLSTTPATPSAVGTYPIAAAIGTLAASNYTFTFVNGTLTIGKAALTVTAASPTITYGQSVPTYTATITGFVNGDTLATAVTGSAGLSTNVTVLLGDGTGNAANLVAKGPYTVGTNPELLATGDFNRDGKLDLIVPNLGASTVSILYGNGDGTFQAQTTVTVGAGPNNVWVADFTGDGNPDFATANYNAGTISVMKGDGTGNFTNFAGSPYTVGTNPLMVTAADFNKDGKLDLAVANAAGNSISTLRGNGDGTFQTPVTISTGVGTKPWGLAVGDFDGDGNLDLGWQSQTTGAFTVMLGLGTGSFATPVATTLTTTNNNFPGAADLNGDGRSDLVFPNSTAVAVFMSLENFTTSTAGPIV